MSKRQLRSDTAGATALATELPLSKRQKKVAPVRYLCYACDEEKAAGSFPEYNPSSECDHLIHTCKNCLKQWVNTQIEENLFITGGEDGKAYGIKCPQCDELMRNINIELATTKKFHQLFEERERHHFAEITPGWRWCLAPGCRAGQIHKKVEAKEEAENKEHQETKEHSKPKRKGKKTLWPFSKKTDSQVKTSESAEDIEKQADICTCNDCGAKACVSCDRPWHTSETCEAYQARIKDRMDEEDRTLKAIGRLSKKCPGCQKNIEKNGGCPAMHCSACNVGFCWMCLSIFDNGYCKCHPRPQR
ncbi:E3 ubiquitin- ligase [Lecanosticta acicola]|uniref:RBR-type E3 ubiquitin transferase n=1 Tax=Lecanosticta acicola TaxID=111012 RepID=A0AAI9ECG6_9PEZI|nr:E3 ubiquitin- ligase [Lecanosticta acicola]